MTKKIITTLLLIIIPLLFIILCSESDNDSNIPDNVNINNYKTSNNDESKESESKTNNNTEDSSQKNNNGFLEMKIEVIREIDHEGDFIFTQGFEIYDGYLYEGTGLRSETSLKKIDLETGDIIYQKSIEDYFESNTYFGEGISIWKDEIIHLSWKKGKAYVYSVKDFTKLDKEFNYDTEGWGLTKDEEHLIMSDGSSYLYYRNPDTFEIVKKLEVSYNDKPIDNINELEYVSGIIYANIWMKTFIVMIDENTGEIIGRVDARDLICCQLSYKDSNAVLNGIAFNPETNTFYITGKKCPLIYEVRFVEK